MTASASIQGLAGRRRGIGRRSRGPMAAMACVAVLLGGCKSGAVSGSGGGDHGGSGGNGSNGGNGGGGNGGSRYGFGLPSGPLSGDAPDGEVYAALQAKDCRGAQKILGPGPTYSQSFPEILEIGIAVCGGDLQTAQNKLTRLQLPGFTRQTWFVCELYRASASVAYQRPRSAFGTCPPPPVESPDPSASDGSAEPSGPANSTGPSDSSGSSSGTGG
jgi:hypothetical protein